jgi:hypothetical protein
MIGIVSPTFQPNSLASVLPMMHAVRFALNASCCSSGTWHSGYIANIVSGSTPNCAKKFFWLR